MLALLALVWLLLPSRNEGPGVKLTGEALGCGLRVAAVHLVPWRLGLSLDGPKIAAADGQAAPLLCLTRLAARRYNIEALLMRLGRSSPEPAKAAPPALALHNIRLIDGALRFDDRPESRQHPLSALQLSRPFVSTSMRM